MSNWCLLTKFWYWHQIQTALWNRHAKCCLFFCFDKYLFTCCAVLHHSGGIPFLCHKQRDGIIKSAWKQGKSPSNKHTGRFRRVYVHTRYLCGMSWWHLPTTYSGATLLYHMIKECIILHKEWSLLPLIHHLLSGPFVFLRHWSVKGCSIS